MVSLPTTKEKRPLSPEMTALQAFGHLSRQLAAIEDAERQRIVATDDPEAVHAARVALRKLRSMLRGFADMLSDKVATELKDELVARFRQLGPLRDADVRAAALAGGPGAEAAMAEAARLRVLIRADFAKNPRPPLPDLIARWLERPAKLAPGARRARLATAPVSVLAARALQVAWTELLAFGPDLDRLMPEERHEFRKRMKDMRYLADFFLPLWREGKEARKMLRHIQQIQAKLGDLNDIEVMRLEGTEHLPAETQSREKACRKAVGKSWDRLRRFDAWWHVAAA